MISGLQQALSFRERDLAAEGLFLLEGAFLLERALSLHFEIVELLCVPAALERWEEAARGICRPQAHSEAELASLAGYPFHRGVLALARRRPIPALGSADELGGGHALCLYQVSDPDNLGALMRSAAALGASSILLGPGSADPFYRKALRSSMGAALHLPIFSIDRGGLELVRESGRSLVSASLDGMDIRDAASGLEGRSLVLCLGNEGWGLPPEVTELCQISVRIPMQEGVDSLNVGAAGAILMWELFSGKAGKTKERGPILEGCGQKLPQQGAES